MDMSTTHPDLRRPPDQRAEYEAHQMLDDQTADAEQVVANFAATFERAINPAGIRVRRVVLTGPWHVDPDRVEK